MNEISYTSTHVIVYLTNKYGEKIDSFTIDHENFYYIKHIHWSLRPDGYIYNFKYGRLHRYLYTINDIDIPSNKQVDHIDRNTLNNCWSNLRLVTRSENQINRNLQTNNITGYKNIGFDNTRNKFLVQIQRQGRKTIRKRFDTFNDALEFRNYIIEEVYNETPVVEEYK